MGDFGAVSELILPTHISVVSFYGAGAEARVASVGAPASTTWVANLAVYCPLTIPWPYPVRRVFWGNGSAASSSVDVGIYSVNGALLASAGGVAQSGASALQYATLSADILLSPGRYYLGYACNGTTNRTWAMAVTAANGELAGLVQQSTAYPLPTSMSPAAYAGQGLPFIGITRTDSGF